MRTLLMALFALGIFAPIGDHERLATCVGNHPCKACKNCSQCKYCHKDGGYCGVCSKPIPE